jgi:hypothetical protein
MPFANIKVPQTALKEQGGCIEDRSAPLILAGVVISALHAASYREPVVL